MSPIMRYTLYLGLSFSDQNTLTLFWLTRILLPFSPHIWHDGYERIPLRKCVKEVIQNIPKIPLGHLFIVRMVHSILTLSPASPGLSITRGSQGSQANSGPGCPQPCLRKPVERTVNKIDPGRLTEPGSISEDSEALKSHNIWCKLQHNSGST